MDIRVTALPLVLALFASCSDRILLRDTYDSGTATPAPVDSGYRKGSWSNDAECAYEYQKIWHDDIQSPSVILVMDRSSAVGQPFGGSTKSEAMNSALQYLLLEKGYQASIKFGFIEYPGPTSQCGNNSCCASKQIVASLNNYTTINNFIRCDQFSSPSQCPPLTTDAPLHSALLQASDAIDQSVKRYWDSPQYLVILSAAEPGCAGRGNSCETAANAAAGLAEQNANILSVAVGWIPGESSCMQRILQANNSKAPQGTQRFFSPQSEKELYSNLESIFSSISKDVCTLDVYENIETNRKVMVLFDGVQVATSGPDRWEFDASYTHIQFKGQACENLMRGKVRELDVVYACSTCPGPNACSGRNYQ